MKATLIGILLPLSFLLKANEKQDSLLYLLNQAESDSVKISLLLKLGMATSGEVQCNYFKKAYTFDSLYNYKYLGHKPLYNLALLNLNRMKTDSVECYLEKALQIATRDKDSTAIAKIYQTYGNFYLHKGDNNSTLFYYQQGRKIFESIKDSFNYFRLYNNEAIIYLRMGKIDEAREIFQTIIENSVHPRDNWVQASAHLTLGAIYTNATNYKEALDNQLNAYNIWKEMNDSINFCKALNNIGVTYKRLSMYSLAKASYQEIIDTNPKGDPYALPLALANISGIYAHQKEFNDANQYINAALEKIETIGDLYYKTILSNIKADILIKEGKYAKAKSIVESNLEISKENNYSDPYGSSLSFYATILYKTKNNKEALSFAQKALEHSTKNMDKQHQFANNYLIGKILTEMGQEVMANSYLMKSLELNDSIKKEKEDKDLIESALTYEIGKRDAINESLKNEARLNQTIIEKTGALVKSQRIIIIIIAASFLFCFLMLLIIFRDNKIKKKLNKQLNTSNNEVIEKNKKLEEILKIKNKILSVISHDLKSPMISLLNATYMLRDSELSSEMKEKILNSTESQVEATLELLENLLNWAKTHVGGIHVNLEKVNIYEIVEQSYKLTQQSIEEKELVFRNNCIKETELTGDKNLLDIVIRNLLSNAIKFTPRKGQIIIDGIANNHETSLSISDSGKGIDKESIKKIFSPDDFITTRGTENERGSGLGLKLCKNYVEYMHGELTVESEPGVGSKFTVTIPAQNEHCNNP